MKIMKKSLLILLFFVINTTSILAQIYRTKSTVHDSIVNVSVKKLSELNHLSNSPTYDIAYFSDLMLFASNEKLVSLTNHKSPIVRCYAFRGLVERKHGDFKNIFEKHLNDTSHVILYSTSGFCLHEWNCSVRQYMLNELGPSSDEFKKYWPKYR